MRDARRHVPDGPSRRGRVGHLEELTHTWGIDVHGVVNYHLHHGWPAEPGELSEKDAPLSVAVSHSPVAMPPD